MKKNVAYVLIHTKEYYSATGKKEILPFVITQMNLENITISDKVKERQILFGRTYM